MNFASQLLTDSSVLVGGTNTAGTLVFPALTFPFDTSLKAFKIVCYMCEWDFFSLKDLTTWYHKT